MRVRLAEPMSDDALFALCEANRGLRVERTAQGELLIMARTGMETGRQNFILTTLVGAWAMRDGSGVGFDSSTGFLMPNGAERSPDVAWIRRERWDRVPAPDRLKFAPLCPDFVVELMSPSDSLTEAQAKMDEYLANGAQLGWLIQPTSRTAFLYRSGRAIERLESPASLSGDPLLPGFVLEFATIC